MEKHKHYKAMGLLHSSFMWGIKPYNSQNVGKVKPHKTARVWEKTNIPKLQGFSGEAEIHTVPKTWEKWISIAREKIWENTNISNLRFLKYIWGSRNPYNSQNMEKVNSHNTEKEWENTNIWNLWVS